MLTDQSLRYYRDSVAEEVNVFPIGVQGEPQVLPNWPWQVVFADAKVLEHCSSGLCAS